MPRDADSSLLWWEVTASDCQDLGNESHLVPAFPDLPRCHHIMIIKWLWKYFFLSQPRSLTKVLLMPVELCLGTCTLFPSLSSGLLLHLDLGCRYWGCWTERWQTSKLFLLLTSFLTSHFCTPPLPKRKIKLLPSFFATCLTAPTTHCHKPVSLLSPAWALDSDFSNSREQKRHCLYLQRFH